MIYKALIFISILIICCSSYQKENKSVFKDDDIIPWSNKKLTWDDFQGVPDTTEAFTKALTHSVINFKYYNTYTYIIQTNFIKSKSWTVTAHKQTLDHEQLHFDITELYARKIRRSFDSLTVKKNISSKDFNEIYNLNIKKCNSYQDLYDHQVYGNNVNQQKWIKKVGAELLKLKKYEYILEE
ncbi:hypothetical protein IRZ71_05495 [Flavobacterium sp. ANB]|uniref:hypothetical protein n=1 Tax=unclassified Flavobacterium TaxID=196869 RepID=UPI0012B74B22|nr:MULTISPECIES: hypothetical protein [unclassified Flavobacterium]MBF4515784.1 hypothetical protein [Flavobacterium sp. ANB]MTD68787.1 hypothetical protein [Flavobacterium sp. LC2016-13]